MPNQYTNPWTPELDDILFDLAGQKSFNVMAKRTGRSVKAVKRRLQRLGLEDKHVASGTMSARALAQAVGVDQKTVLRWIKDKGLKGEQRSFDYRDTRRYKPYFIVPEDFWEWAEKNRDKIDFTKVEPMTLLPEPEWFDAERRKPRKPRAIPWTPEEDNKAWNMYYSGVMQKDIAEELGRTRDSVEKRLKRLRKMKGVAV